MTKPKTMLIDLNVKSLEEVAASFEWQIPNIGNCVYDLCDRHASDRDLVAVIEDLGGGNVKRWTYNELSVVSQAISAGLTEYGIHPGDRIAFSLPQGGAYLAVLFAIIRIGAIAVPLSTVFAGPALSSRLADCGSRLWITSVPDRLDNAARPTTLERIVSLKMERGELSLAALTRSGQSSACLAGSPTTPILIMYTSGSTGSPKGVVHCARVLYGLLPVFQLGMNLAPRIGDVFWTPSDWAWLGSLGELVLPPLYFGYPVVASSEKFSLELAYALMERHRVSCALIPIEVLRRMRACETSQRPSALRAVYTGGQVLSREVRCWAEDNLCPNINEAYGQTEATDLATGCEALYQTPYGSLGRPLPWRTIKVADEDGSTLGPNLIGEILVDAHDPIVMLEYWGKTALTQQKIRQGWLHTGDLGEFDQDGFLYFRGRMDDLIKISGMQVGIAEVESAILAHPQVEDVGVVGVPVEDTEVVAAFVLLREMTDITQKVAADLRQSVKSLYAAHAAPRIIESVKTFPRTVTGKIDRKKLRQLFLEGRLDSLR